MDVLMLLLLILMNGLFAMSEMAVVSSRKARLQQWADDRKPGASAALALANDPSNFLATIQVGITLVGITSGAFGEAALVDDVSQWLARWPLLAPHSDGAAIALVIGGITVTSLIIGELAPKRLALRNPEAVASFIAAPMRVLSMLAYPLVRALSWTTGMVLRGLGLRAAEPRPVTEEEIKILMEQGAAAGIFAAHEQALVARAFRFDRIKVGGIMTHRTAMVCLDLEEDREAHIRRIIEHGHARFPVVRGGLDRIEGIVRAHSLLADALAGKPLELSRHVSKPLYVPVTASAMELMEQFRMHQQTIAIVVNEHGAVDGLVTLNDVLESLVGDVGTVEQEEERDLVKREDGSWLIDGSVTTERVKLALSIDELLPGEEKGAFHTLGGFVMEHVGRVPTAGDHFACAGWRWEVVDMDAMRVDKVLATPLGDPAPAFETKPSPPEGRSGH